MASTGNDGAVGNGVSDVGDGAVKEGVGDVRYPRWHIYRWSFSIFTKSLFGHMPGITIIRSSYVNILFTSNPIISPYSSISYCNCC